MAFETKSVVPSPNHEATLQLCDEKYYHVVHDSWHIPQFEPSEWNVKQSTNKFNSLFSLSQLSLT